MDWSHYGMTRRPFGAAADLGSYFSTPSTDALQCDLRAALERGEGIALLDGPAGVGKTFQALKWLHQLAPEVPCVWLPHVPAAKPADLLQAILFDLNQPYEGMNEQELRLAVTSQLLEFLQSTTPIVLVIDEAQHLSAEAMEELRLLGNIENRNGKGLFTVLVAQNSLRERLKQPPLESFSQRLTTRCTLSPLTDAESREYLRHHIALAGGDAESLLPEESCAVLAASCGGLPRVLNRAAGLAFDLALAAESESADVEAVVEALSRLDIESVEPDDSATLHEAPRTAQPTLAVNSRAKSAGAPDKARESVDLSPPKQKVSRRRSA